ncbi:copper chaperone PCu(A)C [Sphingomonas abietis]|uniref:Copper chaperone PCu(A)C n=1 Tax=Sphingomonas abietis TaxID=3012344 RepID=A0ABY7NK21_9SPHN|nr:copper chaperone PCu(A)C [Sphingomonas abietis]WBO20947.1 copper chaperone PCu(A)C [Sphingomonas abietis]
MRFAHVAPVMLLVLAACHHEATLSADHGWVRLPAVPGHPGAAYLVIHGGPVPARLLAVESKAAGASELHESMATGRGGATGMARLDGVDVPAHGELRFAPGGRHVMLFGLSPAWKAKGRMPLSLRFATGQSLTVDAMVVGAGDAAPY